MSKLVPKPPDPDKRIEPLPWETPKSSEDDTDAAARVKALVNSAGYCRADQDTEFLETNDTRGVRLQLDYLKPERFLRAHGIEHTIVVFGSTRIPEPAEANRRLNKARENVQKDPGNEDLLKRQQIAERIKAKSQYYRVAQEFGQIVGEAGRGPRDCRMVLMTGGGPGIMEAANRGAYRVGAKTAGLNIVLPHEQFPNPYISPDLCFSVRYFAIRKLHFLLRAKALVVFPGGFGTLDELYETLTLVQTRKILPLPIILVGRKFWSKVFKPDLLVEEGVIDPEDCDLFWYAETAEEIWQGIILWYEKAGIDLMSRTVDG